MDFEVKMKDNSALPRFIQLTRQPVLALSINNPVVGASPIEVGTFVLQLLLRDIFGGYAALDITVIVETPMASPPYPAGIGYCYTENVIPSIFAYDTLYITGTLKHTKIQMILPRNSMYVDCQDAMHLTAELVDANSNFLGRLPWYMYMDVQNRQLVTFIPSS